MILDLSSSHGPGGGSSAGDSGRTAMPQGAAAAFDLPSMPVPYEDFQYSLDLPSGIEPSDLSLLSGTDFDDLLGGMSASDFMGGQGSALFSGLTPAGTPRATDGEDHHMAASEERSGPPSSFNAPPAPSGPSLFSFDDMMGAAANNASGSGSNTHEAESEAGPSAPPAKRAVAGMPAGMGTSLFDASETSFLDNFLEGFDASWDFNPTLPEGMPSFADAQRLAAFTASSSAAAVFASPSAALGRSGAAARPARRTRRGSNSGSTPRGGDASAGTSPRSEGGAAETSASVAFGSALDGWAEEAEEDERRRAPGRKRTAAMPKSASAVSITPSSAGVDGMDVDGVYAPPQASSSSIVPGIGKKLKVDHESPRAPGEEAGETAGTPNADGTSRRELLTEGEKRQNHILSEQRRRNHIREAFKDLVELLESGRAFGARGLGLASGAGTGIEDEGLDDRESDDLASSEDDEAARAKRRKARSKRAQPGRGRGKGRGRGGSAGGGAGSKSAVLFQAVDLIRWLDGRKEGIEEQCEVLERVAAGGPLPAASTSTS